MAKKVVSDPFAEVKKAQEQNAELLENARKAGRLPEGEHIYKQFGTWVVTDKGLRCLTTEIYVPFEQVGEEPWLTSMSDRRTVDMRHFAPAYELALGMMLRKSQMVRW